MRISLFITCYNDTLFPGTGRSVVEILERLGHDVDFPEAQTCCGQMHWNTGYLREAAPLARKFVTDFREAETICVPSASCAVTIRHAYPKIAEAEGDPQLARDIEALLPRVYEFVELLTDKLGVEDVGAYYPHRVTYHPSCHSLRGLQLGDRPARLLRHVRGIDLVELPNEAECCGFGGTFSVKNADTSAAMLSEKVQSVVSTGAEVCAAGDNSCLMHIFGALHRQRTGVGVAHIADILAATEEAAG